MAAHSNFAILRGYEEQLWRLGALAERYFAQDPNTCLLKLRQFTELLAQTLAARTGLYQSPDALLALADRVEARYKDACARIDRLTPALLAKAFRGELVPQDPSDEPASVLLERIRAERAAAPIRPKRGRKARESA